MFNPINKIDYNDVLEKRQEKFFAFSKHIKEKYQLNNDILRILDLITFEELLALKLEKAVDLFNGKFFLPLKDIYRDYITKAVFILINAYDDDIKLKRKVRSTLVLNRRHKLRIYDLYKRMAFHTEYDKK